MRLCWQWCANECNNTPSNVGSCCVCVGSGLQTDATTHQQCWELLRPCWHRCANGCNNSQQCWAQHRGKNSTHKTLKTMCNAHAWPQQCWKSCANGSNIVALHFGDHGTKEMLGVVGSKVWPNSNFAQKLQNTPTTYNNMQKGVQTDATCNKVGRWWSRMLRPFSRGLSVVQWNSTKPPPVNITTLFWVSFFENIVKKQARKGLSTTIF